MTNSEKYHFADFTYKAYDGLLKQAKQNYTFRLYTDFNPDERFILWRHDIDFSVHNALDLAKIEHENDVKATYFIHLHSEFYNVFEKGVSSLLHEIKKLGHDVGLHFDTHYYDIKSEDALEEKITFEANVLNSIFNTEVKVFSFHNTNPFVLSCQKQTYAGLMNTYSEFFQKQVPYCSDSYGVWRFRRLKEVLDAATDKHLQVLTHPELWSKEVKSPIERVMRCIEGRSDKTKDFYLTFLKNNGREIIDW